MKSVIFSLFLSWYSGVGGGVPATVQVLTAHVDNTKQNWNSQERVLTPTLIQSVNFGRIGTLTVSGYSFSQPIFVPSVVTSGGTKDLVIAATMNNIVYAFDANNLGAAVWSASFGSLHSGTSATLYSQLFGCISSPAADIALQKVYVVCGNAGPNWNLFVLSLVDGTVLNTQTILPDVTGTGDPNGGDCVSGGVLTMCPGQTFARSSVTLANGHIYLCFGSSGDFRPYHGWLVALKQSDLSQTGVWCATPNAYGGAIWMSGGGAAVDAAGNVYVTTGNGTYNGTDAFSDSVVKLDAVTLAVLDWFTPSVQGALEAGDLDVSANRAFLLPNSQVLIAGKANQVYVMGQGCMGHLQGSSGCAIQAFPTNGVGGSGAASSFIGTYAGAFGLDHVYLPTLGGPIYSFAYSQGLFNVTPTHTSLSSPYPGGQISISSNGALNGILWILSPLTGAGNSVAQGVLTALDPVTLSQLYTFQYGSYAKFASPLIANGRVFVSTCDGSIVVFGRTS